MRTGKHHFKFTITFCLSRNSTKKRERERERRLKRGTIAGLRIGGASTTLPTSMPFNVS
jgi:hypothetical protein